MASTISGSIPHCYGRDGYQVILAKRCCRASGIYKRESKGYDKGQISLLALAEGIGNRGFHNKLHFGLHGNL